MDQLVERWVPHQYYTPCPCHWGPLPGCPGPSQCLHMSLSRPPETVTRIQARNKLVSTMMRLIWQLNGPANCGAHLVAPVVAKVPPQHRKTSSSCQRTRGKPKQHCLKPVHYSHGSVLFPRCFSIHLVLQSGSNPLMRGPVRPMSAFIQLNRRNDMSVL